MTKLTNIAIILLLMGFLVSLSGILITANCKEKDFDKCLLKREYLFPDFYWHFNTIKYVSSHGSFPYKVAAYIDGGPKGDFIPEDDQKPPIFHPPLYYFLAAIPYKITKSLFTLHIFSIFIILLSNIIFFFFLKEVSKKIRGKNSFILYSLALFIFLPIQLFSSIMIHPGVLFIFFFIFFLYFFMKAMTSLEIKNFILLGIMMGLAMLTSLKGIILPFSLFLYLIILLIRKNHSRIKLFFLSLLISIPIGSYQFLKNFLNFGTPLGLWRDILIPYKLIRVFEPFIAFWGGVYGRNNFIQPILIIFISILISITIYSLISSKFGKKLNIDFITLIGLITILLSINTFCKPTYFLKYFECRGMISEGRYLASLVPVIVIFPSIIFSKIKNNFLKKIIFLFVLILCILFSIDFIWAFLYNHL